MTEELVGTVLGDGHYRIDSTVGSGGQGTVYRGTHLTLNIPVAIKVLPSYFARDDAMRTRFAREAQRAAGLRHSNIVATLDYDYDDERGLYYIVSEFIQGTDLKKLLKATDGPLTMEQALHYLSQVASALQHAHDRNIVHRDIKPANVLIDERDDRAVLCDFGLARMIEGEHMEVTSAQGGMPGTPAYMSPEQCLGQELDHRSDIYSLGMVAYEMLVGRNAFRGAHDTSESIKYKHVNEPPPPPRDLNPDLSRSAEAALLRALAKDPDWRFQSTSGFVSALEASGKAELAAGPTPADLDLTVLPPEATPLPPEPAALPAPPKARPRKRRRRKRSRVGLRLLMVAGAVALVVVLVPGPRDYAEGLWSQVSDDVATLAGSSKYFEDLWDLLFGEASREPTATVEMRQPTPTQAGPGAVSQTKTAPAVASTRTGVAASATKRVPPTRTPTRASPTSTSQPVSGEVVIRIEGLFELELHCSTLVLFKGGRAVRRIPLEGGREFRIPRRSVDWFRLEGSLDGKCPWTRWRLSNYDPNHIDIVGDEIILKFVRAK